MKTRIITAIVGILVLIGVMFTFNTMVFNLVIAAITLIAIHEIYSALGFEKKDWLMYAVLVPYTLLVMLSSYSAMRKLVMPMSFVLVTFFCHLSGGAQRHNQLPEGQRSFGVFGHRDLLLLLFYPAQGASAGGKIRL